MAFGGVENKYQLDKDTKAEGLGDSTLLKLINKNPNDEKIYDEFLKWNKGTINGRRIVLPGLRFRRKREADLYFQKPVNSQILKSIL